jgi:hypothetical protein
MRSSSETNSSTRPPSATSTNDVPRPRRQSLRPLLVRERIPVIRSTRDGPDAGGDNGGPAALNGHLDLLLDHAVCMKIRATLPRERSSSLYAGVRKRVRPWVATRRSRADLTHGFNPITHRSPGVTHNRSGAACDRPKEAATSMRTGQPERLDATRRLTSDPEPTTLERAPHPFHRATRPRKRVAESAGNRHLRPRPQQGIRAEWNDSSTFERRSNTETESIGPAFPAPFPLDFT